MADGEPAEQRIEVSLVNEVDSDHPLHLPFYIHGAARFLILSRHGEPQTSLVWKETVLERAEPTADIQLEVSNPGCGWRTATSLSAPRAA